jgi:hypothetical protein
VSPPALKPEKADSDAAEGAAEDEKPDGAKAERADTADTAEGGVENAENWEISVGGMEP